MEDSVPGDEDIVKEDHGVEFVATGSEWMFHVRFFDCAFATYERDTGCVGRQCRVDDLLAHNTGTEEYSDVDVVGEGCSRSDRLNAANYDAVVPRPDHSKSRRLRDRKSTRLNSVTNATHVCRLTL